MPVLTTNGQTISYIKEGSGPVVVFLHSLGSSLHMWREQIAALKSSYTTIALDFRGHGQSGNGEINLSAGAGDIKALLDHLGVNRCDLVGISMGGSIALIFYAQWPDMVRSLVLAGCCARVAEDSAERVEATREAIAYISMQEFGTQYAAECLMPSTPLLVQEELAGVIARISPKVYIQSMNSALLDDIMPLLPSVRVPTLVLIGENEMATLREEAEFLVQNISGATLEVIPAAGHLSCLDNPADFNTALAKFFEANQASP